VDVYCCLLLIYLEHSLHTLYITCAIDNLIAAPDLATRIRSESISDEDKGGALAGKAEQLSSSNTVCTDLRSVSHFMHTANAPMSYKDGDTNTDNAPQFPYKSYTMDASTQVSTTVEV
jgi:hypothetical protein